MVGLDIEFEYYLNLLYELQYLICEIKFKKF
jgi:hypothetical protein